DDDAVADGGMPLAALGAGTAQGDALVDQHVVADLAGLADDDSGAVIDEETMTDAGARVDLDAREEAAHLRDHARNQRQIPAVELVGETMEQERLKAGIAEDDFKDALSRRVLAENGFDLLPDSLKHDKPCLK